jgi:glycosyltransferase involved in cell wall biosynthesis
VQGYGVSRVALLTEIPAPYRIPLFNELAQRVELTVLFLRDRDPQRPYRLHDDEFRFEWRILRGRDLMLRGRWVVLNAGVLRTLRRLRPDAVLVGGWNEPAFLLAAAWARGRGVPVVLWSESTGSDRRSGRLETAKRVLLRLPHGFVVPGRAAAAYLEQLGVARDRIAVAPNAVDPAVFTAAEPPTNDRPVVLAVGRLAPEKGIDVLLRAVQGLEVDLLIAGTGPEEHRLRQLAASNVRFLGQVDRDDLPALYAEADVVAMPSRSEPWGMVLNEAAFVGRPLVATTAAGAALELIEDGGNGFRVPPDDVEALRGVLRRLVADRALRVEMGARSRGRARGFTPAAWADAVADAVARAGRG